MVKESKAPDPGEPVVKKRRVTKANITAEVAVKPPVSDTDMYGDVVGFEEKEAKERNPEEDTALYMKTCGEIRELLMEIAELKKKTGEQATFLMKEKQIQATLKIVALKKLNRLEKVRTKESRLALQKAREQVDSDHLHLQNMLYEVLHLSKEVQKCLEFRSKDEEMDLVPIDEFYVMAPENVSKREITEKDEHQLKKARLQYELLQRKELSTQCKKLEASKSAVAKEIEAKNEQLNSLEPNLKIILDATKPLQENLSIQIDKVKKIHEKALMLPKALYVIFVQADAFSKTIKWMTVSIAGECDKVISEELHLDDISSDDSDSDNEGDQSHRRKVSFIDRRKSEASQADKLEQKKKECLKKHPLSVILTISCKTGESITLELQWLMVLEVVCVLPNVTSSDTTGLAAEDLLSARNVLSSLFPGDTGEELPDPSTHYQLRRASLDAFPLNIAALGIPYRWAQEMCGIDILATTQEARVSLCQANLERVLKMVRSRLADRASLAREVHKLETSSFSVSEKRQGTIISSFVTVSLQEFMHVASARGLIEEKTVDGAFIFYKGTILAHPAKVLAYIAVPPNYPKETPIFLLEVNHKKVMTSSNSTCLRDMEREINVYIAEPEECELGLLLRQVRRLLLCLEVYLHTECGSDLPGAPMFFRHCQGRNRSRPFRFVQTAGGIYTHR